jgi:hypothetical protein
VQYGVVPRLLLTYVRIEDIKQAAPHFIHRLKASSTLDNTFVDLL